ncbi:nicotinamide riboside kinase 1 isoform X3 [Pelmatolapia mariae]|uniref:nicotinamide riboside kinase 1 isoform X3 n=1 Tax=Pelmatolapia mariae TaxID=158779 RepID=UPI002FE67F09
MEEKLHLPQVCKSKYPTAASLHRIHILRMTLRCRWTAMGSSNMTMMMRDVDSWRRDPESFLRQQGLETQLIEPSVDNEVFVLIVEGFLIFNYRPLDELFDKKYFMEIPYDACKRRRSLRVYTPPDPPGYFDGYVWPMYLKNREEIESDTSEFVFLDGLKPKEELLAAVYKDICQEIQRLREKN